MPKMPIVIPPGFVTWSAAELAQRDTRLSARMGPDHSARETLADYGNPSRAHRFRFIHRDADGMPEIHDDIIDLVCVRSGAATLLVGATWSTAQGAGAPALLAGCGIPWAPAI